MRAYIIGRGEDLESIAARMGFDPDEVWEADENEELREQRHSAQVLAPGDVLYVPDVEPVELDVSAKTTNSYRADIEYVEVRLRLALGSSEPRANEPYEVHGLRNIISGSSDGDGKISFEVPAHVRRVHVYFPEQGSATRVELGGLDPETEDEGVRTRLCNLGYLASDDLLGPRLSNDRSPRERAQELRAAVVRFQRAHGIEATGDLDEDTRAAIRDEHGV